MLGPGEDKRNEQDDYQGSRNQDRADVASDHYSFFASSHLCPLFVSLTRASCLRKSLMPPPGNRFHFVPSSRSMTPTIARHSYLFGFRTSRRRTLQRCYGRVRGKAPTGGVVVFIQLGVNAAHRSKNDYRKKFPNRSSLLVPAPIHSSGRKIYSPKLA